MCLVLHVLGQFVRIQNSRNGLLHATLILHRLPQRLLSFLQIQVTGVIAGELLDLNQKVSQVLLESGQVLVQVKESLDYEVYLNALETKN